MAVRRLQDNTIEEKEKKKKQGEDQPEARLVDTDDDF